MLEESETKTATDATLPWDEASLRGCPAVLHLTLAWSLHEPERVGQTAPIVEKCLFGRGGARGTDRAPRLLLSKPRPTGDTRPEPLESSRISRVQLLIEPVGPLSARIRNVGRSALQHNGTFVEQAVIRAGDTVILQNAAVFFVEQRPTRLALNRPEIGKTPFEFGSADPFGIVGETPPAWRLRDDILFAASADRHVLLLGESGVGKELAARALHAQSRRGTRPLVSRNAATFPSTLVDAELFGNAKNYPNVGSPERVGLIGEADGSNLFLDEIGELPAEQQTHLLRVLDREGEYQRLGESRSRGSNFRLLAATNRGVEALKDDLCARFSVRVTVPSLNERRADIPLLVRQLMQEARRSNPENCERFFSPGGHCRVNPSLIAALLRHSYRHNVRELERLLWLGMSTSRGSFIDLTDEVNQELRDARTPRQKRPSAELREAPGPTPEQVAQALAAAGGSKTEAARLLGLKSRYALYRLLKK